RAVIGGRGVRPRLRRGITGIHASHSRSCPSTTSSPTSDPPRCRAAGRTNSGSKNGFGSTARNARSPQAATSCGLSSRSGINRPAERRDLRPTSARPVGTETGKPAKVTLPLSTMQQHAKHRAPSPRGTARTLFWRSIHGVSRGLARIAAEGLVGVDGPDDPFRLGGGGHQTSEIDGQQELRQARRTFALLRLADDSYQRDPGVRTARCSRLLIGQAGVASNAAGGGPLVLALVGGPAKDQPVPTVVRCRERRQDVAPGEGLVYEHPQRYLRTRSSGHIGDTPDNRGPPEKSESPYYQRFPRADARTRTGDPFITRDSGGLSGRSRAATGGNE